MRPQMSPLLEETIGKQETVDPEDFSLVLGGPLYQLFVRSSFATRTEGTLNVVIEKLP